ncbi:DNA cytosine methyltransferase [Pedobacter africanus]|uniref:DNA (cytosine-5-)-methyltransferase n=1 Tax=Pedobacter africanus TaxID=151894 RepID=A0A1W2CSD5_9SPHI|nr:DNA cytosine methyltransferase [Pedobacter africanus]SMC87802.1 DNA (cytosine-5)-methyltransferase 1 [Pedobacter africanus]
MSFPIIDLFAGPGGLAEGFSSLTDADRERVFKIKLSIEKDYYAHQTLTLRSFVRQFPLGELPGEYYDFLEGKIEIDSLYKKFPEEYHEASNEAWLATLGQTPETEIDQRITNLVGNEEHWVLIGGPPCQAYSSAGRSRVGGIHKDDHRVYLYKEYLRIIARHHPAVFVMENVEGLLSAKLDGEKIFGWILRDLRDPASVFGDHNSPGYRIYSLVTDDVQNDVDYLIKAEDYGVPQKRHRVILLGVRENILTRPGILTPTDEVGLRSIIGMLPKIRSGMNRTFTHSVLVPKEDGGLKKKRFYTKAEDSPGNWAELTSNIRTEIGKLLNVEADVDPAVIPLNIGSAYLPCNQQLINPGHPLASWYSDSKMTGVTQHESRGHLTQDLKRYLFAALFTVKFNKFPKMKDYKLFDEELLPDHDSADSGNFTDRFRVQVPDRPATTVTSHISKDGHYFIHYDHIQCRSLTVREAARIQTFPDNYWFCGGRTEQFHQVGNAVPPYLAYKIAKVVYELLQVETAEAVSAETVSKAGLTATE